MQWSASCPIAHRLATPARPLAQRLLEANRTQNLERERLAEEAAAAALANRTNASASSHLIPLYSCLFSRTGNTLGWGGASVESPVFEYFNKKRFYKDRILTPISEVAEFVAAKRGNGNVLWETESGDRVTGVDC